MEQPMTQTQLELLCIRAADAVPCRTIKHTAAVTLTKPRPHKRIWAVLRRGTAVCLSAVLLTATPKPSAILPDLVLQNEIAGFPVSFSAADLPTISLADRLTEEIKTPPQSSNPPNENTGAPEVPPVQLDTGIDLPANSRNSGSLLARLFDRATSESVRTLTIAPTSSYGYDTCGAVFVFNGSGKTLDLAALFSKPLAISPVSAEPKVLIYHTHACEAYTPGELDSYTTDASDRCTDPVYSVVRVGSEMAAMLRSYGIGVIHDTTLYDEAAYTGAYGRSLESVQRILAKYPSIEVVIDVHRDALNQPDAQKYKLLTEVDGTECAQMMLVMGTDAAAGDHPQWEENLKLALRLQQRLLARSATLMRPIKLTRSSYNQFTAPGAMILEVGANGNALSEAILAGQAFAEELARLLLAIT
ncbi:MAG: stage II sporulation protein P [Clostridia bacterium]|nr:stage II sporulation protein P [Clostridia bacterium]